MSTFGTGMDRGPGTVRAPARGAPTFHVEEVVK